MLPRACTSKKITGYGVELSVARSFAFYPAAGFELRFRTLS